MDGVIDETGAQKDVAVAPPQVPKRPPPSPKRPPPPPSVSKASGTPSLNELDLPEAPLRLSLELESVDEEDEPLLVPDLQPRSDASVASPDASEEQPNTPHGEAQAPAPLLAEAEPVRPSRDEWNVQREEKETAPRPLAPESRPYSPRAMPQRASSRETRSNSGGGSLFIKGAGAAVLVAGAVITIVLLQGTDPEPEMNMAVATQAVATHVVPTGVVEGAGTLHVNSNPPGLEVYLDGRRLGVTPLVSRDVQAGRQELRIGAEEGASHLVFVIPNEAIEVFVEGS